MVIAIGVFSPVAHAQHSSPLRFVLGPDTRWLTPQQLAVHYELVNVSDASVYVVQFPGPSVMATCRTETGAVGTGSDEPHVDFGNYRAATIKQGNRWLAIVGIPLSVAPAVIAAL